MQKEKGRMIPTERYTLILKHEYVDEEGNRHELNEPIVVTCIMQQDMQFGYVSIVINDMIERMRQYVLQKIRGGEEQRGEQNDYLRIPPELGKVRWQSVVHEKFVTEEDQGEQE